MRSRTRSTAPRQAALWLRTAVLLRGQKPCDRVCWMQAPSGLNLPALLQCLGLLSQVLQACGAPARSEPAAEVQAALLPQLGAAHAAGEQDSLAAGLVKALALLRIQARLLRMDLANARLAMLAHDLKDGAGLR